MDVCVNVHMSKIMSTPIKVLNKSILEPWMATFGGTGVEASEKNFYVRNKIFLKVFK